MAKFDENSTLSAVMEDEQGNEVLKKHMGDMLNNPMVGMMKGKTLAELKAMIPMPDLQAKFEAVVEDLKAL